MEHTTSEWKDEGSVRPARRSKPRVEEQYDAPERDEKRASAAALAHIEATVGKKINSVVGDVAAKRLTAKLALALDAFERERWQDAKRIIIPVSRDCPGIKLIHEIAGLSLYRLGQWRDAADHLEQARAVSGGEVLNHPVVIAEGRIVAAGALADKGDVQAAVRLMQLAKQDPAKVREHHLREWYVLADLYDRSGDLINARSIFQRIAANDSNFSDVRDRLATLGVA
jgi:tetratricopeptide (TPR) repeat protein